MAGAVEIKLRPIGVIHSPYQQQSDAPRQGRVLETESKIEVFPDFFDGLKSIERISHLIVLYWADRSDRNVLQSQTPFSDVPLGVFTSRSPNRPNPIGFCVAEVIRIHENIITVRGLDALDGSPLLDLKVYSPQIDCAPEATSDDIPPEVLSTPHSRDKAMQSE